MSLLARAFVPLWGRGNKFLWKPGGVFLVCFQDFRLNFLSLFVLKFFLGKCEILNSIEKPLSKHFLIWKNAVGCEFIRKPIWFATKNHLGNGFLFPIKVDFECIRETTWFATKNHLKYEFSFQKNFQFIRKTTWFATKNHLGYAFSFQKNFQFIRKTTWFATKNHLKYEFFFQKLGKLRIYGFW